jgi:hypothetical protein
MGSGGESGVQADHGKERAMAPGRKQPLWQRVLTWFALAVLVLLMVNAVVTVPVGGRLRYTCVLCRLERVDTWRFGREASRIEETVCSKWYREHVEAEHEHVWDRHTCSPHLNVLGRPVGVSCHLRGHRIWLLRPEEQIGVYENLGDAEEAKALFLSLVDEEAIATHRDREIAWVLKEWVESGFDGLWQPPQEPAADSAEP